MKKIFHSVVVSLLGSLLSINAQNNLSLNYNSPASIWEATLPLGNGRIGMMPDGGIDKEKIVLNDITMWSGSVDKDALNPDAIKYLPKIRQLLLEGKNLEAQNLMYEHFRCGGLGSNGGNSKDTPYGSFQLLGNMYITYNYHDNSTINKYKRSLSLNDAVAMTSFKRGNVNYSREYYASYTNDVLLIKIKADRKKSVSFSINLSRPERGTTHTENNSLYMEGQLNDGYNTDKGVRYLTKVQILNTGGAVSSSDKTLTVKNADEAIILISSSTNMLDKNYKTTVEKLFSDAKKTNYNTLKNNHIKAFQQKFNRVELNLGEQNIQTPTNERLREFQTNDDPAFAALYFQFGRYLMISGTNEHSMPLNLQGLWAESVQTPWNGDYHLNINVQMNYWPAEVCNLSELHKPLIKYTESLVPSGTATAKTFYNADGWVAHVISNPWLFTAPGEHASWGATNTGGAWLCEHLWEHYAFNQDKNYLKSIYQTLKGAADFLLSNMISEPKHGWLVTAPSSSPENGFYLPGSNEISFVCMGPTMDVEIVKELFGNVLKGAKILGIEDTTTKKIREVLPKLPPLQISPEGYLQEWLEDYKEMDVHHRHVSHLYGLYPSNQISPYTTPDLAKAAGVTLDRRGDGGTGWSRAWKINFWARLRDGNRAYKLLKSLLEPSIKNEMNMNERDSGTSPNLFCSHPPFQIDGNLGGTAGIAEMLIQSQNNFIELIPAIPDKWQNGSFKGLRVRGGAQVSARWEKMKVIQAEIMAEVDNTFTLKVPSEITEISINGKTVHPENGFLNIPLKKGEKSIIHFK